MSRIISNCGLICTECPAYIARQTDDDDLRRKTAAEWSKMYNAAITLESVNCCGCLSDDGVLFNHCTVCQIRACCRNKRVLNCAGCSEYACEKISEFFGWVPEAKKTLDEIREGMK